MSPNNHPIYPVPPERILTTADAYAVSQGCWWDQSAADKIMLYFEHVLVHASNKRFAGKPFIPLKWQREEILEPLFAWKNPDGSRRFNKVTIFVAKKNGKTTLALGIATALQILEGESGLGIFLAATSKEHANKLLFQPLRAMVAASPVLSEVLEVIPSQKIVVYRQDNGLAPNTIHIVPREARGVEGINGHVIADEVHAYPNREQYDALKYAGESIDNPLFIQISTFGKSTKELWYQEYRQGLKINDGTFKDTSTMVRIYAAHKDDDILDPETHKKANPSYGETISSTRLMTAAKRAVEYRSELPAFLRYRLNVLTNNEKSWFKREDWEKCEPKTELEPLEYRKSCIENLKGARCYGGLDLGAISDLTSFALFFPDGDGQQDDRPMALIWCWAPDAGSWTEDKKRKPWYDQWAEDGLITMTDGNVTDQNIVRGKILELAEYFDIRKIAVDTLFDGYGISSDLREEGLIVHKLGPSFYHMSSPSRRLEELVIEGKFNHGANGVFNWMAEHVQAQTSTKNEHHLRPVKPDNGEEDKIDAFIAVLGGIHRWMSDGERPEEEEDIDDMLYAFNMS